MYILLSLVFALLACQWASAYSRPPVPRIAVSAAVKNTISAALTLAPVSVCNNRQRSLAMCSTEKSEEAAKEPSAFDQVASKGLAGVLAIALAETIFWALGMPLAALWVKFTTGEWIDLMSTEGQLQAAGFTFGYGGFATVILQYRVTLFAIPLVPLMERLVVEPGKKLFGETFGEKTGQ